jgi:Flp pilus assembly protein TadD
MPNKDSHPSWQTVMICAVIIIDLAVFFLSRYVEKDASYDYSQAMREQGELCGSRFGSLDRYGIFYSAYNQATAETSNSFSLNDYLASGTDPQIRNDNVNSAITSLQCVIKITPEEDGAWNDLAWLYAVNGDTSQAIATAERAISFYKYDYTYYVILGAFLERSGRIDEARAAYSNALVLYPRLLNSTFWHSLQARHHALADDSIHSAFESLNNSPLLIDEIARSEVRARMLFMNGSVGEANSIVDSINLQLPNQSGTWELKGELNERDGRVADAILDFQRSAFLDPKDPVPHEHLAAIEINLNNADEARNQALLAWKLAQYPWCPGAARRRLEYRRIDQPRNDELPVTLLKETQPSFDFHLIFIGLSRIFASQGNEKRAKEMEHMADLSTRYELN